uniref:Uncharacterized protein n=1 Tax=Panagrolaimus davidi TaxID=227884 RepID=A0A914QZJ3_9BILA
MDAIKEMVKALPPVTDKFVKHQRQNFAFHKESFIEYILKNCSGIVYEKLVRTCKYFYFVARIVPVKDYNNGNFGCVRKSKTAPIVEKVVESKSIAIKLWFTGKLYLCAPGNSLINFMWRCDVTELGLSEQELTRDEFLKITQNVKELNFYQSKVFSATGQRLTIGDILALVPQIVHFYSNKNTRYNPITIRQSNHALPYLPHLQRIELSRVPNSLDYNEIIEFLKEHPNVHFYICFIKRHWDFHYHGAFMNAVKNAFPNGKVEYKVEFDRHNDRSAFHGDRTWSLTYKNMKIELFGEGDSLS